MLMKKKKGTKRQLKAQPQTVQKQNVQKQTAQKQAAQKKKAPKKEKKSLRERLFPRREPADPVILVCSVILLVLGVAMAGSLSNNAAFASYRASVMKLVSQMLFMVMFLVVYLFVDKFFTFKFMKIFGIPLLAVYFILMGLVPAIGRGEYGAKSWIPIGSFTLQPSELFKPLIIALCAWMVHTYAKNRKLTAPGWKNALRITWMPFLSLIGTIILLIVQKDFGTMVIIVGIAVVCFLIPSIPCLKPWQTFTKWAVGLVIIFSAFFFFITDIGTNLLGSIDWTDHITIRIENTKNPYKDVMGDGFQIGNGLYAIADGGFTGNGYGNSERKYGFLTQAESDFILSIVVEELGLFGLLTVTVCTLLLGWRLFGFAIRARDQGDKVILGGAAAHFLMHFIVNVGGVGGLIPLTGVPLLLVSAGGSSILASAISLGMAQSAIRRIREQAKKEKAQSAVQEEQREEALPVSQPLLKGAAS